MQFSVSESINALKGKLYVQPYPFYSSTPSQDLINPGFSLNLYSDIVPLNNGRDSQYKVVAKGNEILESETVENQTGSGLTNEEIQHSFQHPRPIKTETLYIKKSQGKRKIESSEQCDVKKPKKIKHKFQFV